MRAVKLLLTAAVAIVAAAAQQLGAGAVTPACAAGLALVQGPARPDGTPGYRACLRIGSPGAGSRIDPRYSRAASVATGSDVVVVCWARADWRRVDEAATRSFGEGTRGTGGFVWEGQIVANVPPDLCSILDEIAYGGRRTVERWSAWAFKNLTHEALHVAGIDVEAVAECYAMQLMGTTIAELGLPIRYASRLAAVSFARYPRLQRLDPAYFSEECRNGGELDLGLIGRGAS